MSGQLQFEPDTHTYLYQGSALPSVTQILDPWSGLENVNAGLLKIAGEFGTHVHQAVHLFNIGELDRKSLTTTMKVYLKGWENFLSDTGAVVILSEQQVYSRQMGYAGTFDTVVRMGETYRLIDVKTSATIPKTVGPQTAAYAEALREMTGQPRMRRLCVHLNPKLFTGYSLRQLSDPRDLDIFKAALSLHRWSKEA